MTKIVLIYANWCGHCKSMLPAWEKFKNVNKNNKLGLDITEIEFSELHKYKDWEPFVRGFPTILKIDKKPPKEYSGNRSAESFVNFALGK